MGLLNEWKDSDSDDIGEIPMAAMPDIAFLLLVFFMVSTTFLVSRKINVELPSYEGESSKEKVLRINVSLGPNRVQVKYGDEKRQMQIIGLQRYVQGVISQAENQNEKVVLLDVDDTCPYQRVVDAFDAIRAGGGYVSLVKSEETEK